MQEYIYAADCYCEACGEAIRARLAAEGSAPTDPDDEHSYDSDDYPKGPYDASERDYPGHCASGPDCLAPTEMADGTKVGQFFENDLTTDGVNYVNAAIRENPNNKVVQLWARFYADSHNGILPLPDDLPSPYFDRFDVCEAHAVLEWDWNVGGILQERPTNERRNRSTDVQLHAMRFRPSPMLNYDRLSENGKAIYWHNVYAWGLKTRSEASK